LFLTRRSALSSSIQNVREELQAEAAGRVILHEGDLRYQGKSMLAQVTHTHTHAAAAAAAATFSEMSVNG
jgi:hypothetical protein